MKFDKMKNVELHIHTEESKNDSASTLKEVFTRAKEMGIEKIAITEHGVVTSYDSALALGKEMGIEVVLGVEAYVRLHNEATEGRCHMCFYSKNETGNIVLFQMITDSNLNLEQGGFPVMSEELLTSYLAKGKEGYNNIIGTSACISGVLANVIRQNVLLEKRITKANAYLEKIGYIEAPLEEIEAVEFHIENLDAEISELSVIANKKYGRRRLTLRKLEGTDEYEALFKTLQEEEFETESAKQKVSELKEEKKTVKKQLTLLNQTRKKAESIEEKSKKYLDEIEFCKNHMLSEEEIYELAKKKALWYQTLLGDGNFYVELQYHGMEEEAEVMPILARLARELSLPVVICNDAHMVRSGAENVRARQIIRSIRNISDKNKEGDMWVEEGIADKELYMKSNQELAEYVSKILPEDIVEEGIRNRGELLDKCEMVVNSTPHYPKYPTEIVGETSEGCLRRKAKEGIKVRFPDGFPDERYEKQMEYELDVMCSMGFADYHLIVMDYVKYAKIVGKFDFDNLPEDFEEHKFDIPWLIEKSKGMLGLGVGPARGSGAGSLVCYLLEITDIDPIPYNLLFERFLNPERVSMPDIDTDFAPHLREICYEYVADKYGEERVCKILTRNKNKSKSSIDNCAKLLGDKLYANTMKFNNLATIMKGMVVDGELPSRSAVEEKFKGDKNALRIYDDACLINNTFSFYGCHAAGVVISDHEPIKNHVALMHDASGTMKTQCDMVQVEGDHGLLKMDFLGLMNLEIITDTIRMIQKNYGISVDIEHLPFETEVFTNIYGKGFTNGVFQVESQGMKQMLKQAHPKNIEDIIILISMYRPGPMDFLDDLIQVMNGRKKIEYLVPELEHILGTTYGAIVYQEQVMRIFQDLAGYSLGGADMVRRFMSKKKADKLAKEKDAFVHGDESRGICGCVANGIDEGSAYILFGQMEEFAKYAFNKSHATAYAIVSYMTAWLKYHYPKEFLAVSLGYVNSDKRKGFIADAKELGIEVCLPDVNQSEVNFSVKDGKIYYGLKYILEVSNKAKNIINERKKGGKYSSLANFVQRTCMGGNVLKHMILCGAFSNIQKEGRLSLLKGSESFPETVKIISDKRKKLKDESISEKTRTNAENALEMAIEILESTSYENVADDLITILNHEQNLMGMMLSGHPSDDYDYPSDIKVTPLKNVYVSKYLNTMGAIVNLRLTKRKSDGKDMAFFDLDMPDATLPCCVFTDAYAKNKDYIQEGNVIVVSGAVNEKTDDFLGEEETVLQMIAKEIRFAERKKESFTVFPDAKTKDEWVAFREFMKPFEKEDGHILNVYNSVANRFFVADFKVSKEILYAPIHTEINFLED